MCWFFIFQGPQGEAGVSGDKGERGEAVRLRHVTVNYFARNFKSGKTLNLLCFTLFENVN